MSGILNLSCHLAEEQEVHKTWERRDSFSVWKGMAHLRRLSEWNARSQPVAHVIVLFKDTLFERSVCIDERRLVTIMQVFD